MIAASDCASLFRREKLHQRRAAILAKFGKVNHELSDSRSYAIEWAGQRVIEHTFCAMNDSEKARKLADAVDGIIKRKYQRYARTVAERLDSTYSPLALSVAGEPATRWNEFKTHLCQKPHLRDVVDTFVKKCCSELLKELPADEHSVLWLSDIVDRGKRDALVYELYDWVRDLAVKQVAREAFYARTPNESTPLSVTSDEIVIPLADFLLRVELLQDLIHQLNRHTRIDHHLHWCDEDPEEVDEALQDLFSGNPEILNDEDVEEAMKLPRNERGEYLFECVITNTSTGRDPGFLRK